MYEAQRGTATVLANLCRHSAVGTRHAGLHLVIEVVGWSSFGHIGTIAHALLQYASSYASIFASRNETKQAFK